MNAPLPHASLSLWAAAAAGGCGLLAAGIWGVRRWRRKPPDEIERLRRTRINLIGRIAGGEIIDALPAPAAQLPPTLVYQYAVAGVTYEVSQALHLVPVDFDPRALIPGWPVQVKFDPNNPGNSIVACEGWKGLGARAKAGA